MHTESSNTIEKDDAQLVCFLWDSHEMGIPIIQVKETLASRPMTRVFLTPPFVMGVVNVRGEILAVLDLARLMGLSPVKYRQESKIIVVKAKGRKWGILVDSMTGVKTLADGRKSEAKELFPQAPMWLTGVLSYEGVSIGILDMESLINTEDLQALLKTDRAFAA